MTTETGPWRRAAEGVRIPTPLVAAGDAEASRDDAREWSWLLGRQALLWAGCLIPFAAAIHLVVWYWPGAVPIDVTSGVWIALARDFADGILYRPLMGPDGYGGTRYMPLFLLVHGGLMRLGLDPISSGIGLMLASAVLFDVALYRTLREMGVRAAVALPLTLLGHASASVQLLTLSVKCDLLASALNLAGVALALRYVRRPRTSTLAGALGLLVAAVFTKVTVVSGLIATVALVRARRGARVALVASAGIVGLFGAGLAALSIASDGRFWTSFLAVGSGGVHLAYAVRFPLWFGLMLVEDPCALLMVAAAVHGAVVETRSGRRTFAVSYFWLVLALTVPVFATPGTDNNHLVDLVGASILVVGDHLQRRAASARWIPALPLAVAALTLTGYVPGMISLRSVITAIGKPERRAIEEILARSGPADQLLSEDPLIPVLGGARPIVSDPFSLRLLAASRPEIRADFARRVDEGRFKTVILLDWSGSDAEHAMAAMVSRSDRGVDRFYGGVHFPPGFLQSLARRYVVTAVAHPFVTFVPTAGPRS